MLQVILTTFQVAYESGFLTSQRWSSLILDNPPTAMTSVQISAVYNISARHKIIISDGKSATLGKIRCFHISKH